VVPIRGDSDHEMSHFLVFGLPRIDLNEVKGCLELAAFSENGLILHGLSS